MTLRYEQASDTLTITLGPRMSEAFEHKAGDFTVTIDNTDSLVEISIARASHFVAQALATGIEVEGVPAIPPAQSGTVWHQVESSMISAFGYDEKTGILEVAFNSIGVYRYHEVPQHVVKGLHNASSKGSYMRSIIIEMYPTEKKR